jgi:LPS sulfotransferase NodH
VSSVLRAIGLPDGDVPVPPTSRQRDQRSEEWSTRYREERKEAA